MPQPHTSPRPAPRRPRRAVAGLLATLVVAGTGIGPWGAARASTGSVGPTGTIVSVAGATIGSRHYGFSGDGGPATSAQIYHPRGIAFDAAGNAYIADALNHRIRRIDPGGTITTVAGNGNAAFGGDGGPAVHAALNQPHAVAVDAAGNLYIADAQNNRIRRVDPGGVITTVAGTGVPGFSGDGGPGRAAQVGFTKSMAILGNDLYIADTTNHRVRVVNLGNGVITTVAGTGTAGFTGDNGPGTRARLDAPGGVWATQDGTLFVADTNNHRIRRVDGNGVITTVAGTGIAGSSGDGGPALQARLNGPRGIATDTAGNVFVSEELAHRIRRIDPSGTIVTIAGNGIAGFSGDGGPASHASVHTVRGLDFDSKGNLWVADTFNSRVRVIASAAAAGGAEAPPPPSAHRSGYWMLGSEARIYAFGDARSLGDPSSLLPAGSTAVHVEPTPSGNGYWILADHGHVYAFGDASAFGNPTMSRLRAGEKVTSLSATPTGQGYWIFTTIGRVLSFGDAQFYGDMTAVTLNGPVLNSVATPSGRGYYMVASDGGVFAFGDARFHGSMGDKRLNQPVQSLVPDARGTGYWLVASDGGIFAFGTAPFLGSMGATPLNKPVVGMVRYGNGYLMVAADGGIFNFSDRPFAGSLGADPPSRPVVAVATLDVG